MNLELRENNPLSIISSLGISIDDAERMLLDAPQIDAPVQHHFGPGVYIREVFMPKDSFVIGHYHKTEHLSIFLKGKMTIVGDDGISKDIEAPMIIPCKVGRKTASIHEDSVWLNIHATEERDIEKLEDMLLDKSAAFTDHQLKMISCPNNEARDDFDLYLEQTGFDREWVRETSENTEDQIPFPNGVVPVCVSDSPIEGKGLFATGNFLGGDLIAVGRVGNMRTPAGRYTNHSKNNNAKFEVFGDEIWLVATKDISGQSGGMLGDEITIDYRQTLELKGKTLCHH